MCLAHNLLIIINLQKAGNPWVGLPAEGELFVLVCCLFYFGFEID
jgi:hypothetical protein